SIVTVGETKAKCAGNATGNTSPPASPWRCCSCSSSYQQGSEAVRSTVTVCQVGPEPRPETNSGDAPPTTQRSENECSPCTQTSRPSPATGENAAATVRRRR